MADWPIGQVEADTEKGGGQSEEPRPIGCGPVAVREIAVIAGVLDHAVQRDVFEEFEGSHLSLSLLRLEYARTSLQRVIQRRREKRL